MKVTYSLPVKIAAILLLTVTVAIGIVGALTTVLMADSGFYTYANPSYYESDACAAITWRQVERLQSRYTELWTSKGLSERDQYLWEQYLREFDADNTNFLFTIQNERGETTLSNYAGQEYGYHMETTLYPYGRYIWNDAGEMVGIGQEYTITCYVRSPIQANDAHYAPYRLFQFCLSWKYAIPAIAAVSCLMAVLLFIFLLCAAGHHRGEEAVRPGLFERIPLDVYAGLMIAVTALAALPLIEYSGSSNGIVLLLDGLFALLAFLLAIAFCMSFAIRCKLGAFWKNTVIYRILHGIWRLIRWFGRGLMQIVHHWPLLWKMLLGCGIWILLDIILIASASYFLLIWTRLALTAILCIVVLNMNRLKQGAQRMAEGDLDHRVETASLLWEFRRHADNLNSIRNGMALAVEERLKSERFKTELITNVSHDIKTPLTSIVNYVDLLKKENLGNETAQQYLEVLDRQSARLKKLIEDLVEASKASTGNITVHAEATNIGELLTQAVGEYTERFAASQLEPVLGLPEEELRVLADGRLLWRVFDNLLGNICKYSQPGTRVYLNLSAGEDSVCLIFRNISRCPLNISGEELMERFVRGDSSRSTEGSGLGLSIARSLTELQDGRLEISVDGDLFKVLLTLNRLPDEAPAEPDVDTDES